MYTLVFAYASETALATKGVEYDISLPSLFGCFFAGVALVAWRHPELLPIPWPPAESPTLRSLLIAAFAAVAVLFFVLAAISVGGRI
jgi:hypothetical protein